jgi:hypothetical protein
MPAAGELPPTCPSDAANRELVAFCPPARRRAVLGESCARTSADFSSVANLSEVDQTGDIGGLLAVRSAIPCDVREFVAPNEACAGAAAFGVGVHVDAGV